MIKIILPAVFFLFAAQSLSAMSFTVGARGGYYIWDPYVKEIENWEEIGRGDGVLGGPVAGVAFTPRLSLSTVLLLGKQSTEWSRDNELIYDGAYKLRSGTSYFMMFRIDLDSALSYRITDKLGLFLGYKYQKTTLEKRSTERTYFVASGNSQVRDADITLENPSHGPAAGGSINLPFLENYFFSTSLSALFMKGRYRITEFKWQIYQAPGFLQTPKVVEADLPDLDIYTYGMNVEPAVGGRIGGYGPVVIIGLRYQLLLMKFEDNDYDILPEGYMKDHIYGVFISALFQM